MGVTLGRVTRLTYMAARIAEVPISIACAGRVQLSIGAQCYQNCYLRPGRRPDRRHPREP